ncbi:MFS transporter [Hyphomonas oceanitis]|uniref:Sugar transporter n=1 Tax=Hyphomonas oceanitis SCH89 TaxID=1280953 RepID=A0A059G5K6_9PROT|nr:MFS transporter [Hyphomonas oceanitis]KDA01855.1 hypothetical protein HOC_13099 [Hyphomonas oceanitis SCH89]
MSGIEKSEWGHKRLPPVSTLLFGFGSTAVGIKDMGFRTILLLYYNQVIGLPAGQVAATIMIALICDAVLDPIIGEISDNFRSRWGRRHPFMYAAALPVSIAYVFLWLPPEGWGVGNTLIYMFVLSVFIRSFITFYEIPSAALTPELTKDYDERTRLISIRFIFYFVGGSLLTIITFRYFLQPSAEYPVGQLNPAGYRIYAYLSGALMFASMIVSALGTHKYIKYLEQPKTDRRRSILHVLREMRETVSDRSFIMVAAASFCKAAALGISGALSAYMSTFFWKLSAGQISLLMIDSFFAVGFAYAMATRLSKRFGKRNVAIACYVLSIIFASWPAILKVTGIALQPGDASVVPVLFLNGIVFGGLGISSTILAGSMIADCVEEAQKKTGRRSEGLMFAINGLIGKIVSGFGVFGAGMVLAFVGFPEKANPNDVSIEVVNNMWYTYMVVVAVLYAAGTWLLTQYNITKADHERNIMELEAEAGNEAQVATLGRNVQ